MRVVGKPSSLLLSHLLSLLLSELHLQPQLLWLHQAAFASARHCLLCSHGHRAFPSASPCPAFQLGKGLLPHSGNPGCVWIGITPAWSLLVRCSGDGEPTLRVEAGSGHGEAQRGHQEPPCLPVPRTGWVFPTGKTEFKESQGWKGPTRLSPTQS